ncbi:membrane progestin receptor epsilon [Pteronotus mesoamericanus]|uniref:membrane progestin receptor epsilon n=1 Tax=Pteronotus mesoamericanus TaxID=1884717 RepID=UPI0023EC0A8E|nr:membrane progestin receptor epsilon [Pteronotus parnellii mesoamericanus]
MTELRPPKERLLRGSGLHLNLQRHPPHEHKGSDGGWRGLRSAREPAPEVACSRPTQARGTMPRRLQPRSAGTKGPPATTETALAATSRPHPSASGDPPASAKSLLRWDEVPDDFVECFILSGYRRLPCTAQECLASVLKPTNETLNFWTHFIPLLLFLSKFCRLFFLSGRDVPFHHPWLLPLWCYASGVLLTFAMSCTAHVFSCLSLRLRAAFFYLDYASISYYGFGSTVAYYYYLLPSLSLLDARVMTPYVQQRLGWHVDCTRLIAAYRALVLPVAFLLAVACTVACCKSRTDWCSYPFALRTFVFIMPLSMACPIMLESWLFDLRGENPTLYVHFYRRYFWLVVAAFFNVSKIPERIQPGLFDIIGHSHQLFHIFTFLSIYDQVYYVEEGLRQFLKAPPAAPTFSGTVGYMLLLVVCLGLVIRKFLNSSEFCSKK